MFRRNILKELGKWMAKPDRKPLIIRGARQTGKTVAVSIFAEGFEQFINLNLERDSDRNLFEKSESVAQTIRAIELYKNTKIVTGKTLLFIDEIQSSEKAVKFLRFFYEDHPQLHVIAAGSLLEAIMVKEGFSFPVGRVEFLYLHPVTFDEFLIASGRENILDDLQGVSLKNRPSAVLHKLAGELFNQYAIIGGMPAAIAKFLESGSFQSVGETREDLITAIKDDTAKYSKTSEAKYLRHVIEYAPYYTGERIKYEKFGNSDFHSREIKQAIDLLEYAMIVQRVFGSPATEPPIQPNFGVSPKLLFLDSGLVIQKLGLSEEMVFIEDLNNLFRGKFAEQVVGQALIAGDFHKRLIPAFWYRNKPGSTAETDYLYQHEGRLIPIEVKSGKSGSLKSLHQFMANSPSDTAVRIYSGELDAQNLSANTTLISVPFYMLFRLREFL